MFVCVVFLPSNQVNHMGFQNVPYIPLANYQIATMYECLQERFPRDIFYTWRCILDALK